jgi:ABC-2 type transport system permease protein
MAWLSAATREQIRAMAVVRWQLFMNSLRSARGRLNLVSRTLGGLLVLGAGFGGAFALGGTAYGITQSNHLEWLAAPFWVVFLFWQLFPVMSTAFSQNLDMSALLRFPLSYPAYFLLRLVFGVLDIATALGVLWSLGLFAGISAANLRLFPWALLITIAFIAFNVLFARMVFAWIEHWLSRRRSKEVLGAIFLLMMIGFQIVGPVLGRYSTKSTPQRLHILAKLAPLQRVLPPGLAESIVTEADHGQRVAALASLALFSVYGAVVFWALNLRLRNQYRGENPAGGEDRRTEQNSGVFSPGWKLPGLGGPATAIFEKELHYFLRSGPMLFTIIMPLIVVLIMWGGRKGLLAEHSSFALPVGAAYCLLLMTNIVYNSFGGDGGGVQFFLVAPVSFRQIAAAKNLAQFTVVAADVLILWLGIRVIYQPPRLRIIALTIAWYLFAVPLNFAVGNLLSVYSPKRIDYSTFGRQRASETTILVSLGVQLAAMGVGALAVFLGHVYSSLWVSSLILLVLAIPSISGYLLLLSRIDRIALARREVLITELCRA